MLPIPFSSVPADRSRASSPPRPSPDRGVRPRAARSGPGASGFGALAALGVALGLALVALLAGATDARAEATICLDFDGHTVDHWKWRDGWLEDVRIPPYNHPGSDPRSLDSSEQFAIDQILAAIAEDYSPFVVRFAVAEPPGRSGEAHPACPASLPRGSALRIVIGGHASDLHPDFDRNGMAIGRSFRSREPRISNTVLIFALNARDRSLLTPLQIANTASHESGHAFGLAHQAEYDAAGNYVDDYEPGDARVAPIMGGGARRSPTDPAEAARTLWWFGPAPPLAENGKLVHPDRRPAFMQDDMEILGSLFPGDLPELYSCRGDYVPDDCEVYPPNGFGFRVDDHGDAGHASPLALNGSARIARGIIERRDDVDWFRFVVPQGPDPVVNVRVQVDVEPFAPNLDARVSIRDASGQHVFDEGDGSGPNGRREFGAAASAALPPGEYRLAVSGHGEPGDTGQYALRLMINSSFGVVRAVPMADRLRITFGATIDPATFTPEDVSIVDGDGQTIDPGRIRVRRVTQLARTWDVLFPTLALRDGVRVTIGPWIRTPARAPMDQDGDRGREDAFVFEDLRGPSVTRVSVEPDALVVDFDEPIDADSFTLRGVDLSDLRGVAFSATGRPTPRSETRFAIPVAGYPTGGFRLEVGEGVRDWFGNRITGVHPYEHRDDSGPAVVSAFLAEDAAGLGLAGDALIVSFDEAIDAASLAFGGAPTIHLAYHPPTTGLIARPTQGIPVAVASITPFSGPAIAGAASQPGRHWLVAFSAPGFGEYDVTVSTRVEDLFGNPMNQDGDGIDGEPLADFYRGRFEIRPRSGTRPIDPEHALDAMHRGIVEPLGTAPQLGPGWPAPDATDDPLAPRTTLPGTAPRLGTESTLKGLTAEPAFDPELAAPRTMDAKSRLGGLLSGEGPR